MELYTAPQGILVPNGHVHVGKALEEIEGMYCTISSQNLVLNHIKNKTVASLAELQPPPDLIPVKNGALSISTGTLVPYQRGMNFFNQFPINYDPNARAPQFFRFLNQIQHDELRRQHILNSFARCFDRTPMKREAELFIGEHDTGKSTLLKVLRFMLGANNCASETLANLTHGEDRWSLGNIFHKAANICADLQTVEITEVGQWKRLTGGDPVTAEFKGKAKFEYLPYVKFFFACNSTPKIIDKDLKEDLAFFERFAITYFENQLTPDQFDETLVIEDRPEESKLINSREISGIFNHCVRILREMRDEKNFRYSFNGEETRSIWFHESSQNKKIDDFLALYTIPKEDGTILVSEFKEKLGVWLLRRHQNLVSDKDINARMEEKFGQQQHGKRRSWKGVAWRDQANASLSDIGYPSKITMDGWTGFEGTPDQYNLKRNRRGGAKNPSNPSSTNLTVRAFFALIEKDAKTVSKNGTAEALDDSAER